MERVRRQAANLLGVIGAALRDCADGLHEQDPNRIAAALGRVRATQSQLDTLRSFVAGGRELTRVSPLHWTSRQQLEKLARQADPLDNAVRNIRVLLRRALTAVLDDEIIHPDIVAEVSRLAEAVDVVRRMLLAPPGGQPDQQAAADALFAAVHDAKPQLLEQAGLSGHIVFGQLRSAAVDLMQVCGMDRLSALAVLPPTVAHPYVPPADWKAPDER
jgi:hypothetical protein